MNEIKAALTAEINMTNNGKLMIANVPQELRSSLPGLLDEGFIVKATFLSYGDAIRLG